MAESGSCVHRTSGGGARALLSSLFTSSNSTTDTSAPTSGVASSGLSGEVTSCVNNTATGNGGILDSVSDSANRLFCGISSRLEAALSFASSDDETETAASSTNINKRLREESTLSDLSLMTTDRIVMVGGGGCSESELDPDSVTSSSVTSRSRSALLQQLDLESECSVAEKVQRWKEGSRMSMSGGTTTVLNQQQQQQQQQSQRRSSTTTKPPASLATSGGHVPRDRSVYGQPPASFSTKPLKSPRPLSRREGSHDSIDSGHNSSCTHSSCKDISNQTSGVGGCSVSTLGGTTTTSTSMLSCSIAGGNESDTGCTTTCHSSVTSSASSSSSSNCSATVSDADDDDDDECDDDAEVGGGGVGRHDAGHDVDADDDDSSLGLVMPSRRRPSVCSWSSEGEMMGGAGHVVGDQIIEATIARFVKRFVRRVFNDYTKNTVEDKALFGEYCRHEVGRICFARCINTKRVRHQRVNESTFYSLVQCFSVVLFECAEAEDWSPAKTLMNMCFTFYHEVKSSDGRTQREHLYVYLRDQPIWKSLRFWNAAFFDALQRERALHKPPPTRSDVDGYSEQDFADEQSFQENITFGQLATFTHNMHSFQLPHEMCSQFLRKQSAIANLPQEQLALLHENISRLYGGGQKKAKISR